MNYLNGGYVMIKHNATQKDLAAAYKSNRPVLVYDENQKAHWAQINETVTTETIDDEVVTTYTYSYQLLNDVASLVDSAGNSRFIEGDLKVNEITGVTFTYGKWSLSGTHLMIVLAGNVANGTTINAQTYFANAYLPAYIIDKIFPVTSTLVDFKSITYYSESPVTTQSANCDLVKDENNGRMRLRSNSITLTANRNFRIQFDLLIDADYSE